MTATKYYWTILDRDRSTGDDPTLKAAAKKTLAATTWPEGTK